MEIERRREKSLRRQFEYIVENVQVTIVEKGFFDAVVFRGIGTTPLSNAITGIFSTTTTRFVDGRRIPSETGGERCACLSSDDDLSRQCRRDRHSTRSTNRLQRISPGSRFVPFERFPMSPTSFDILEAFTFKIRADGRETAVKMEFLLNEIFQSSLIIDLENEQLAGRCELLQLETVQRLKSKRESQSSVQ